MPDVITALAEFIGRMDPGEVVAMALVGSSADGGLRPDSDLDLLILTRRSLSTAERSTLVNRLLQVSGSRATVAPGRPIELTSLRLGDVVPWRYPATRDFLYGEWLRQQYLAGQLPRPEHDSNLPVLITSARRHAITMGGPPLDQLLAPVPEHDLYRSLHDGVPALLDNLVGDERNVLLTLARIVVTLETGLIVPKDRAAAVVAPMLPAGARAAIMRAGQGYLGEITDEWTTDDDAAATAQLLAGRIASLR